MKQAVKDNLNFNDGTIPVFVVNLDRDKMRLALFSDQMKVIGRKFTRWRATSGEELDSKKFCMKPLWKGVFITGFREWSKNEAACGVSHILLLQHIINEKIPYAIILEDDAILQGKLPNLIREFEIPHDAEIVLLNDRAEVGEVMHKGKHFSFGKVTGGAGTDGYLISLSGAKKLLKILYPLNDPLDFQMYSHFQSVQEGDKSPYYWKLPQNASCRETLLQAYRIMPALVGHSNDVSTIGGQRHPRARYYCRVLLGLKMPELHNYYGILNSETKIIQQVAKDKLREYRAVDVSHLDESLSYFEQGNLIPLRPMRILKNNGVNCIRISVWVDNNSKMNIKRAIHLAKLAKADGIDVYLALHYSDSWADPTHQKKPANWENLPFDSLCHTVYDYTRYVLEMFISNEIIPVIVQVGNEITNGFLWESTEESNCGGNLLAKDSNDCAEQWVKFARLIGHAISAVRSTSKQSKIMLQIDKGAEPEIAIWWFDRARTYGLDFDIIGLSFYFLWHHATLNELEKLTSISTTFPDKEICIAETSYPYYPAEGITITPTDGNPPFSRQGQSDYVKGLLKFMRELPNGCGICWWGTFFLNDTFDRCEKLFQAQALFDGQGVALEALSEFNAKDGIA